MFVTRLLIESVPNVELLAGFDVRSRARFGTTLDDFVESSSVTRTPALSLLMGDAKFAGPGAPSRCWTPVMFEPSVSANRKSGPFSFVSFGLPGTVHPTAATKSHSLRKNECSLVVCQRFRDPALYEQLVYMLRPGGVLVITILSTVGLGGEPGPFHAPPGELVCTFRELDVAIERSVELDGETTLVARRR